MNRIKKLTWIILCIMVSVAILLITLGIRKTQDMGSVLVNLGTEFAGAALLYLVLDLVLGKEQKKAGLIANMGSSIRSVSIPAAAELRREKWLFDGSLREAFLAGADLSGASLGYKREVKRFLNFSTDIILSVDLRGANLNGTNLTGSDLSGANLDEEYLTADTKLRDAILTGAILSRKNIHRVDLTGAKHDEKTVFPDGFRPEDAGMIREER